MVLKRNIKVAMNSATTACRKVVVAISFFHAGIFSLAVGREPLALLGHEAVWGAGGAEEWGRSGACNAEMVERRAMQRDPWGWVGRKGCCSGWLRLLKRG